MTKTATPSRVVRNPTSMYAKAIVLRRKLSLVDNDYREATIVMDRWTHENFVRGGQVQFDVSRDGRHNLWQGLKMEVKYYQLPLRPLSPFSAPIEPSLATVYLDDDAFLMSIRYQKENGRIVYIDDPELDPFWQ